VPYHNAFHSKREGASGSRVFKNKVHTRYQIKSLVSWLCAVRSFLFLAHFFNGKREGGIFLRSYSGRGVKLTTPIRPVPRSRKCRCTLPLPHTTPCRTAQLAEHSDRFTLSGLIPSGCPNSSVTITSSAMECYVPNVLHDTVYQAT
jgi:hypothetical protein